MRVILPNVMTTSFLRAPIPCLRPWDFAFRKCTGPLAGAGRAHSPNSGEGSRTLPVVCWFHAKFLILGG
jgi:hypothetical protein